MVTSQSLTFTSASHSSETTSILSLNNPPPPFEHTSTSISESTSLLDPFNVKFRFFWSGPNLCYKLHSLLHVSQFRLLLLLIGFQCKVWQTCMETWAVQHRWPGGRLITPTLALRLKLGKESNVLARQLPECKVWTMSLLFNVFFFALFSLSLSYMYHRSFTTM